MVMPHRLVQGRSDGPVVVPDRHWGIFRPALVVIESGRHAEFGCVLGRHLGATGDGVHRTISQARTPGGLLAPLRAPATAEPLMRRPEPPA